MPRNSLFTLYSEICLQSNLIPTWHLFVTATCDGKKNNDFFRAAVTQELQGAGRLGCPQCTVVVFLSNSPMASMASDFNFQFTRVQKTSNILKIINSSNNFGLILKKGIPDCNYQAQKVHFYFFSLCFGASNFQKIGV